MDAAELVATTDTSFPGAVPWYRRWSMGRNVYDHRELAGAFGDLGTLIPFVLGYIAVTRIDPRERTARGDAFEAARADRTVTRQG